MRLLFIFTFLFSFSVLAQSPNTSDREPARAKGKVIKDIQVIGSKKIEKAAVLERLESKVGQRINSNLVKKDVKTLFNTGYFYNIKVEEKAVKGGTVLVYRLTEKPAISKIAFLGNDEIDDDDLKEAIEIQLFEILNTQKIRKAVDIIKAQYEEKGYFLAEVDSKIIDNKKNNSVTLQFIIKENDKVQVKKINFLGNRNLTDGDLKAVMQTQEGGFFSFVSGSGSYKQEIFDRDVQILTYRYFNEGYIQVKVGRPEVYVTPDKKGIYITIRIEEGDQFRVGNVDFAGDLLFTKDELYDVTEVDELDVFIWEKSQLDIKGLQAKFGDLGYAYANIIPRVRPREKEKIVDITYEIDKGNKVYFGKINVVGNTKTRDKVVRRELRIKEGELYNETRKRESVANVQRLGYFEEVNFNQVTPEGNPDLMDLEIVVKERNTGSIQVGAGYSSFSGFIFNGQVNQINLFGKGQRLGVSVDLSDRQSLFNVNFTEPYFLDTEWSLGFDAYQSRRILRDYTETKKGGALRVGHPLGPYLRGFLRYKLDETEVDVEDDFIDPALYPVETVNGVTSSITATIEYDKRNDRYTPSKGMFISSSLEYAGLGGDLKYTKGFTTFRIYRKVFWEVVFRNNLTYGFIKSNSDEEVPFNERFLLGGPYNLRGYEFATIGERVFSQAIYDRVRAGEDQILGTPDDVSDAEARRLANRPFGGEQQLFYNAELEFPLISEAKIKGVLFFDIGNAADTLRIDDFRSNIGFGFRWFSPIGPLRFEWGFPLDRNAELGEEPVNFEFSIGSPF